MKIKRDKINFQAFIAILIVIVAFSIMCFISLFILYKFGAFRIPKSLFGNENSTTEIKNELHDIAGYVSNYDSERMDLNKYKEIIKYVPMQESFYIQADVTTYTGNSEEAYHYWIWKYENKYKIAILDFETYRTVKTITCDNSRIKIIDTINNITEYYDMTEEYAFINQKPIIDFSKIGKSGFGEVVSVTLNLANINYQIVDEETGNYMNVSIDREYLVPSYYEMYENNVLVRKFSLNSFEEVDYFTDEQFLVD